MRLMTLVDLEGHNVYEFCYAYNYPKHWNATSLFVSGDDFRKIESFLLASLGQVSCGSVQKVSTEQWTHFKRICLKSKKGQALAQFLEDIDAWLEKATMQLECFWIFKL